MIPDLDPATDLFFTRTLAVPRALVWECWTDPGHIPHFFVPKPHRVTACDIDLRVGGRFNTTFEVEGKVMDNRGVYLEVVPQERLVFTDAYTEGWKPAPDPFMTALVILGDAPGGRHDLYRHCAPPDPRHPQGACRRKWDGSSKIRCRPRPSRVWPYPLRNAAPDCGRCQPKSVAWGLWQKRSGAATGPMRTGANRMAQHRSRGIGSSLLKDRIVRGACAAGQVSKGRDSCACWGLLAGRRPSRLGARLAWRRTISLALSAKPAERRAVQIRSRASRAAEAMSMIGSG